MKSNLLLIAPNYILYRDFVYSGLLKQLSLRYKVFLGVFPHMSYLKEEKLPYSDVEWLELPDQRKKDGKEKRILLINSILDWKGKNKLAKDLDIISFKTEINRIRQVSFITYAIKQFTTFLLSHIPSLEKKLLTWRNDYLYDSEIEQAITPVLPDYAIFLDAYNPYHHHLIPVFKNRGVKLIAFIRSWDNITMKGILLDRFDAYFVWNEWMRKELSSFYKDIKLSQIYKIGGLVFDIPIRLRCEIESGDFLYHNQVAKGRLITFMLNYPDLSPAYYEDANDIIRLIQSTESLADVILVMRLQPGPRSRSQFDKMMTLSSQRVIIEREEEVGKGKGLEDLKDYYLHFCRLLHNSSLIINYPSTTSVDAAIFNTPSVTIGYDGDGEKPYELSVRRFLDRTHYKWLADCKGNKIAHSGKDLQMYILSYLQNPEQDKKGRQKIIETICEVPPGESASNIISALENIL